MPLSLSKYLSSPELRLQIGNSRLRRALAGVLIVAEMCAIGLLFLRGYTCESVLLLLLAVALLSRLLVDRTRGLGLVWQGGNWMLLRGAAVLPVKAFGRACSDALVDLLGRRRAFRGSRNASLGLPG